MIKMSQIWWNISTYQSNKLSKQSRIQGKRSGDGGQRGGGLRKKCIKLKTQWRPEDNKNTFDPLTMRGLREPNPAQSKMYII